MKTLWLPFGEPRVTPIRLDKSYQKTDWFNTPLDENLKMYLVTDVWVLHYLVNYLSTCTDTYENTWTREIHSPLCQSLVLDHTLIPCYLQMSLKGISISESTLKSAHEEITAAILFN